MPKTYAEIRQQFHQEIVSAILNEPGLRYADIAKLFGVSNWAINAIVRRYGLTGKLGRKTGPKPKHKRKN